MAKRKAESVPDLAELARRYFREHDLGARHYKRADIVLRELIACGLRPGEKIQLAEYEWVTLKDKLASDIQFFHGSYARRFELERVKI